jgi:hypothetical protein
MRRFTALLLLCCLGCQFHGTDSHTEVFKTPEEVSADRRSKQLEAHKELAVSVLHFARPDIEAKAVAGTSISVRADGISSAIDLAPVEEQMLRHSNEERAILRKYLEAQLKSFDNDRLKALGFQKVKEQAGYVLVSRRTLQEMQAATGTALLMSREIVPGMYRVSVIHGAEQAASIPITVELMTAWNVKPSDIDAAAMQNLREALSAAGDHFAETISVGPAGRTGSLKSDADPAIILVPEFLGAVQKAWQTKDDLVLFCPAPAGIVFVERHNQKLLDLLSPQWKTQLAGNPNPLCEQLLMRDADKIGYADYAPTTKPSTAPATKPVPYIAH